MRDGKLADRIAGAGTLALVFALSIVAARRFADFQPYTTFQDPHGIRSIIEYSSAYLILFWCLTSAPLGIGLLWTKRWAIWGTLILNALYLLPSLATLAPFGTVMHAALVGYAIPRVWTRRA